MNTPKPRLAEEVVRKLKSEILSGSLTLGSKLPTENGLMNRFGVSRTVVREAIAALRNDGLVSSTQGRGMFVTEELPKASIWRDPKEMSDIPQMLDLYEFRLAWEPEAAALAAMRRSATQEFAIRAAHERLIRDVQANLFPHQANHEFHLAIARATGNTIYEAAALRFGPHLRPVSPRPDLSPQQGARYFNTVIPEHTEILEAISVRDPAGARKAMLGHVERSIRSFREEIKEARSEEGAA
ncbi:FadR/GntR family transcriptional regulator [Roseinatronobacter alkalisoli]|uniref:FadR/GntR family transcriptional regulator n=1 Tax=Roseinatronobacter alkalisoli TaxID=3028235 RepID=A0ABT5TGM9_9RHOB|nr:FadR/GntR family transcriptional regulator [Roseinatronobacter sp. HJB301]MDD7973337.1 FadR/GntR family transcriptional regulator [Roseinatronobacter sp. HJB301]